MYSHCLHKQLLIHEFLHTYLDFDVHSQCSVVTFCNPKFDPLGPWAFCPLDVRLLACKHYRGQRFLISDLAAGNDASQSEFKSRTGWNLLAYFYAHNLLKNILRCSLLISEGEQVLQQNEMQFGCAHLQRKLNSIAELCITQFIHC